MNESVVEGMGNVWSECSGDKRHLCLKSSAEEAIVVWSAPQPWHPEAETFINHSLNHMVGKDGKGKQKKLNFTHTGNAHHRQLNLASSVVMKRLKKDRPRLPSAMYDVAA